MTKIASPHLRSIETGGTTESKTVLSMDGMNRRVDDPIRNQNHHSDPTAYGGPTPGATIEYPDQGFIIVELNGRLTLAVWPEGMRL
jgi:hypothetical protein